jgi:integrase
MHGERIEPLLHVLLGTGLRRQEVLGLTWERVRLDGPTPELRVDQRVTRAGGRLAARDGAKTEAGQRRIPLVPMVVDALVARRAIARRPTVPGRPRLPTNLIGAVPALARPVL